MSHRHPSWSHFDHVLLAVLCGALAVGGTANGEPPLSPEEALKSFELADRDLRIELVAAEPLVESPCAMAFDERGRLFVAENRGYPNTSNPPQGRIAMLEDTDGDGCMDKRTTFTDGLTFPNGVMPWRGGLIVTCAPDVLYFKDTNGDGKADDRKVLLTGFATGGSTQLRVNCPTLGPDGWIYFAAGLSGGNITSPEHPDRPALKMTGDLRWQPFTGEFENVDGRSQYGMSFDDYGRRFICMNRVPVQHVVLSSEVLARNPHLAFSETVQDCSERTVKTGLRGGGDGVRLFPISQNITTADSHAGSFSAACGIMIWRGGALPGHYRHCAFTCDPTANLVHADTLGSVGASFVATPVFRKQQREFLASRDDWFRPVFLASGPDGALYVCDMYRKTIEHPYYVPEEIRKRMDFESGKEMGRIWRAITSANPRNWRNRLNEIQAKADSYRNLALRPLAVEMHGEEKIAEIDRRTLQRAVIFYDIGNLGDPTGWQRDLSFRLLLERPLREITEYAGFLRGQITGLGGAQALHLISPFPSSAYSFFAEQPRFLTIAWHRSQGFSSVFEDTGPTYDAATDFQLALALGDCSSSRSLETLAAIAVSGSEDRWTRAAVLSGIAGRERAFAGFLISHERLEPGKPGFRELLSEACRLPAIAADSAFLEWHLERLVSVKEKNVEFISAIAEGVGHRLRLSNSAELIRAAESITRGPLRSSGHCATAMRVLRTLEDPRAESAFCAIEVEKLALDLQTEWARLALLFADNNAVKTLLQSATWRTLSPDVQATAISTLGSRTQFHPLLLDALQEGAVTKVRVLPSQRAALLKSKDPTIRGRAEKLFGTASAGDRAKAFEDVKAALALAANGGHGREVFKTHCAICHRLEREGLAVGPDLLDIRNQPKESILFHLIVPDAEIAPAFAAYFAETKDGRAFSGVLASETPTSVQLRMAGGAEETLLRANLTKLEALPNSLMPAGVEAAMSRQDLADLLAFLKGER